MPLSTFVSLFAPSRSKLTAPTDAPGVADIASWYTGKTFSTDWTTPHISAWTAILASRRQSVVDALEIGSWEGRSAVFWLNYFPRCRLTCIDTFAGSQEHNRQAWTTSVAEAERHFDENLSQFGSRVEKFKANSRDALAEFGIGRRQFDFVYVDGSHRAVDTYTDAMLAWPLVRPRGVMLFDDYTWIDMPDEKDRPKLGIDAFLRGAVGTFRELHRGLQILIEKTMIEAAP